MPKFDFEKDSDSISFEKKKKPVKRENLDTPTGNKTKKDERNYRKGRENKRNFDERIP